MSWLALVPEDVARKVAGPELEAAREAALAEGQPDPLPQIIEDTIGTIRGYIAGCRSNTLGPTGTIPPQLVGTALVLIRTAALNRLPVSSLHTETRREEYRDAITTLHDVSACKFVLEAPATLGPEKITSPAPRIIPRPLNRQSADSDGL
jgi:hypothetical protein